MTKRYRRVDKGYRRIELEDYGQDFLYFVVDPGGRIVETGPFQGWMWNGKIIAADTIRKGICPCFTNGYGLRYPIRRVSRAKVPEAA